MRKLFAAMCCVALLAGASRALVSGWSDWQTVSVGTGTDNSGWRNDTGLGTSFAISMKFSFSSLPTGFDSSCPVLLSFGYDGGYSNRQVIRVALDGWNRNADGSVPLVLTGNAAIPSGAEDDTTVGHRTAPAYNDDVGSRDLTLATDTTYTLDVVRNGDRLAVYWDGELMIETNRVFEQELPGSQVANYFEWGTGPNGDAALGNVSDYTVSEIQYSVTKDPPPVIPEPTALALLALGVAGAALRRRA